MNSERNNPSPEEPDQTPEEPLQGVFDLQSPDSDTPSQPVLPSREEEERAAHEATSALIRQIIEDSESGKLAQQANEKREREEERLQRQADDRRRKKKQIRLEKTKPLSELTRKLQMRLSLNLVKLP